MLSDEKIEELFNKDAFEVFARGHGTVDVIDFDCGMDFARSVEKQTQIETVRKMAKLINCNHCPLEATACDCVKDLTAYINGVEDDK